MHGVSTFSDSSTAGIRNLRFFNHKDFPNDCRAIRYFGATAQAVDPSLRDLEVRSPTSRIVSWVRFTTPERFQMISAMTLYEKNDL